MSERKILLNAELRYQVALPTTVLLQIAGMVTPRQQISNERLDVFPGTNVDYLQVGPLGNRVCRLQLQPGEATINYTAEATLTPDLPSVDALTEVDYLDMPADVFPYLNPSRYCESDKLGKFAADKFAHITPGYDRVSQIADWVNSSLRYAAGTTGPNTSACDVLLQREGVCRDFAHVAIALCRAIGIPARYVSGYAVDLVPPDFHGFFEAFLGDNWILFDATQLAPVAGFARIGAGRDAADVAFATLIGSATLTSMTVSAIDADTGGAGENASEEAVSTA